MQKNNLISRFKYECVIFIAFMISMLYRLPAIGELNPFCTSPYVMNYSLGVHSRLFIGSVFEVLFSPISVNRLYYFIIFSNTMLALVGAIFLGYVIRSTSEGARFGLTAAVALLIASPAAPGFLFYWGNFGRMDVYLLATMWLSLLIMPSGRFRWIVILLMPIAMATHQVFLFTYCPAVVGAFFYEAYRRKSRGTWVGFILMCLMICGSFLFFQFYHAPLAFDNANDMTYALQARSDIPVDLRMIESEYFKNIGNHIDIFVKVGLSDRITRGAIVVLLMLPLVALYIGFWIKCIRRGGQPLLWILLSILPLASLPAFLLTIDWGRWFAALTLSSFSLIFYLTARRERIPSDFFTRFGARVKRHPLLVIALMIYFISLGKFEAANILTRAIQIHQYMGQFL
jgi:hypothetical protein